MEKQGPVLAVLSCKRCKQTYLLELSFPPLVHKETYYKTEGKQLEEYIFNQMYQIVCLWCPVNVQFQNP